MSDYASVVERVRKAYSNLAKLENALSKDPLNVVLQVNLAAMKKLAIKSENELKKISDFQRVDLCSYRLEPELKPRFLLGNVSASLSTFQGLFTQIYDSLKNGPKLRATYGADSEFESAMEIAYTFSGSLGFMLLAANEHNLFEGKLDKSIDVLIDTVDISSSAGVRGVADHFGTAVVKKLYDWSKANIAGRFAADINWRRSDGTYVGKMISSSSMERLVDLVAATSDETNQTLRLEGILVGGDISRNTFHFVVPNGDDYKGSIANEFTTIANMTLGNRYLAVVREKTKMIYATEKTERSLQLVALVERE